MATILLVEDEQSLAQMYKEQLEEEGFTVEIAQDGAQAVEKSNDKPDLVLLDILLPKINGFEVLKKLKETQTTRNIPVIILTNLGSETANEDKNLALALGADDYLVKSYHLPNDVIAKVKTLLSKQHA